ncbi:hypothetical protein VNI00_017538, partial [Paramarasmius palmivorus]
SFQKDWITPTFVCVLKVAEVAICIVEAVILQVNNHHQHHLWERANAHPPSLQHQQTKYEFFRSTSIKGYNGES